MSAVVWWGRICKKKKIFFPPGGKKKKKRTGTFPMESPRRYSISSRSLLLEDHDTVPVVVRRIFLNIRAERCGREAILCDAVGVHELSLDCVGTTLRELHVVFRCTGVLVSITCDDDLLVGVSLEPLSHRVDVDLLCGKNLGTVDSEANSSHERSVHTVFLHNLGTGELSLKGSDSLAASEELGAEVVDLTVEGSDLRNVVALVESIPATAADVEVETAHSLNESIERVAAYVVVPVVSIESRASLSQEVNLLAETGSEQQN